jgi:hypothetical protein
MADLNYNDRPPDYSRLIRNNAPPPPAPRRWRSTLAHVGMWVGAAIAVLLLIASDFGGGRGGARILIAVGVIGGGVGGFLLGLIIDGAVSAGAYGDSQYNEMPPDMRLPDDAPRGPASPDEPRGREEDWSRRYGDDAQDRRDIQR